MNVGTSHGMVFVALFSIDPVHGLIIGGYGDMRSCGSAAKLQDDCSGMRGKYITRTGP